MPTETNLEVNIDEMSDEIANAIFPEASESPTNESVSSPDTDAASADIDAAEADANKTPTSETPVSETPVEETAAATKTPPVADRPTSWTKDALAKWDTLDPVVKAEIMKREGEIHKGIEQYKSDAQIGNRAKEAFAPFVPLLQQHGVDPITHAQNVMGFHHRLLTGNKQNQVELIGLLANQFGITLADFGVEEVDENGESAAAPVVDPHVAHLQQSLQGVTMQLSSIEAERQALKRQTVRSSVETFASDPANKYFDEVAQDITRLITTGAASDLPSAYKLAIRTNETVWAKVQSDLLAEAEAKRTAENAAKAKAAAEAAAKAKKATSANVRTTAKSPAVTGKGNQSIEDTMKEVMDKHYT